MGDWKNKTCLILVHTRFHFPCWQVLKLIWTLARFTSVWTQTRLSSNHWEAEEPMVENYIRAVDRVIINSQNSQQRKNLNYVIFLCCFQSFPEFLTESKPNQKKRRTFICIGFELQSTLIWDSFQTKRRLCKNSLWILTHSCQEKCC